MRCRGVVQIVCMHPTRICLLRRPGEASWLDASGCTELLQQLIWSSSAAANSHAELNSLEQQATVSCCRLLFVTVSCGAAAHSHVDTSSRRRSMP